MPDDLPPDLNEATVQRRREDALLAELAEPDLDEARESHMYGLQRLERCRCIGGNGTDGGG